MCYRRFLKLLFVDIGVILGFLARYFRLAEEYLLALCRSPMTVIL